MPSANRNLTLSVVEGHYAIVKLSPDAAIPEWAMRQGTFFSATRTAEELSLVVAETNLPVGLEASRNWRMLKSTGRSRSAKSASWPPWRTRWPASE